MKDGGQADGQVGGQITFGALDTTNCGPIIAYEPLSSASYWQFKLVRYSAKREEWLISGFDALRRVEPTYDVKIGVDLWLRRLSVDE